MNKRNSTEIHQDIRKIKKAAKTAKSLKEVAQIMGSTYSKVVTTLDKHPIIKKRVIAWLAENRSSNVRATISVAPTKTTNESANPDNFVKTKPDAEGKSIVICDCPAIVYGLNSCIKTNVVIPLFVKKSMVGIARLKFDTAEGKKAKAALSTISAKSGWCTIAPEISSDKVFVKPSYSRFDWRTQKLVALACTYYAEGYDVTVKTRTAAVASLATLQGCLTVDFVKTDEEMKSIS